MVTRRQHYVWRHHREIWQGEDALVSCLRDQKLFRSKPINIMVERDFYKLQKLTGEDIFILKKLLIEKPIPQHIGKLHKSLIEQFASIAEANERVQVNSKCSAADRGSGADRIVRAIRLRSALRRCRLCGHDVTPDQGGI